MVLRSYSKVCVEKPKLDDALQRQEKRRRIKASRDMYINKTLRSLTQYRYYRDQIIYSYSDRQLFLDRLAGIKGIGE